MLAVLVMMEQVENKQVIFRGYIEGAPKETDMEIKISRIQLKAPKGSDSGAFLVKNLYLSCDPYMRGRMRSSFTSSYIPPFVPGQVFIFSITQSIHFRFDFFWIPSIVILVLFMLMKLSASCSSLEYLLPFQLI